jgi:3D (Asp-Asp-Asp) domain-containing protein
MKAPEIITSALVLSLMLLFGIQTARLGDELRRTTVELAAAKESAAAQELQLQEHERILTLAFGQKWDRATPTFSHQVTITCYSSTKRQTDSSPHRMFDGTPVRCGTIAVSPDLIKLYGLKMYQRILIVGYGVFEIRCFTAPELRNTIDIWMPDEKACWLHGRQYTTILWKGVQ